MNVQEFYQISKTGKVIEPKPRFQTAISFFQKRGCKNIFDVAGNDGYFASLLKQSDPTIYIESVDVNSELRALAEKVVSKSYCFDITQIWPIPMCSYDGIHMGAVIEHVFDYKTLFTEAYRVLKPGGGLFISTPNMAWLKHRVQVLAGQMPTWYTQFGHIRLWTAAFLRTKLEEIGFRVIKTYGLWDRNDSGLLRRALLRASPLLSSILIAEVEKPLQIT